MKLKINHFITIKKVSSIIGIIIMCLMCSSCFTYKSLTKKNEKITADVLPRIIPDKKYKVKTKDGVTLRLRIDKIDSIKIYGFIYKADVHNPGKFIVIPYESTLDEFIDSSLKISKRKFNLPLTIATPIVGFFIIVYVSFLTWSGPVL